MRALGAVGRVIGGTVLTVLLGGCCTSALERAAPAAPWFAAGDADTAPDAAEASAERPPSGRVPVGEERSAPAPRLVRRGGACGLACERGCPERLHARFLLGAPTATGEDVHELCTYYGVDLGRTCAGSCCGCWGLDVWYRNHGADFRRRPGGPTVPASARDGGTFHHVGLKATWRRSIGNSRLYGHLGGGPGWFFTEDYLDDDQGFEVFFEGGLGYELHRNVRLGVGVNVHGLSTDVGRKFPADDGESRWLWFVVPVVWVEVSI